jgi:hypothetical protein
MAVRVRPIISLTILTGWLASCSVAKVCRRSWKRIWRSPAEQSRTSNSGLQPLRVELLQMHRLQVDQAQVADDRNGEYRTCVDGRTVDSVTDNQYARNSPTVSRASVVGVGVRGALLHRAQPVPRIVRPRTGRRRPSM